MNYTYNTEFTKHVPKLIFLLTDGDVGNPDSVIAIARKHSRVCRTFTIGLGNGASPYLVREIALNGKGKHEIILNNNNLAEKMMYLLQSSISPVLDDFQFEFDKSIVEYMTPGVNTPLNILKNEPLNIFILLNEKFS